MKGRKGWRECKEEINNERGEYWGAEACLSANMHKETRNAWAEHIVQPGPGGGWGCEGWPSREGQQQVLLGVSQGTGPTESPCIPDLSAKSEIY